MKDIKFTLFLGIMLFAGAYAWAIPAGFNIQGRLTDANGINKDGTFQIKFSVYSGDIGGTPVWEKSFNSVAVKNGNFQVILQGQGDNSAQLETAVKDLEAAYVEIKVGTEAPLVPRQPLLRSPFASSDKIVSKADVLVQSDSQSSGSGLITLRTGSADRLTILNNGNVGVGNNAPDKKLVVSGDAAITGNLSAGNLVGAVMWFYRVSCPSGYLRADGSPITQSAYPGLAEAMGKTGTFNLPDLRGEFVRGLDSGRGVDVGRTLGSTQTDLFRAHSHSVYSINYHNEPGGYSGGGWFGDPIYKNSSTEGGAETRPRNVALLPCIKY